jgi:hypothetical protein
MARGRTERIEVSLEATELTAPSPVSAPPEPAAIATSATPSGSGFRAHARPLAWGTAAAATVALGFAVFETVTWTKKADQFDNHTRLVTDTSGMMTRARDCGERVANRGSDECRRLYDGMQSAKRLAIIGYGVGAALAVGSAVLFLVSPARETAPSNEMSLSTCVPFVAGVGGSCRVRF